MPDQTLARLQAALADRYRVLRELGAGGMATVYLTEDLRHNRKVALKVLRAELSSEVGVERFQREIAIASRLQHPHILTVHDSGEAAGLLWFTMPFVEGESLRDRLERDIQLPIEDALRIAAQVADALDYAHRRGVIHRDIKPENILLSGPHALVADFGIGQVLGAGGGSRITGTGLSIGTPAYMSPEQASAERDLDSRTDVYSLGTVVYEMLAGEAPFTGPTAQAILAKRFSGEVPTIRRTRPTVPEHVDRAVGKALALVPADRFRTPAELAEALETAAPAPVPALPVARMPGAGWIKIGVPVLLVAAALIWLVQWRRTPAAPPSHAIPKSLAVLPFANIGGDSATDYFSDGMSEELIVALGRLPGLRVASRTSSFSLKGKNGAVREIGGKLGVETLLEGSVRRDGQRVRVTARLVEVASDSQLWSQEFDSETEHVFALQDSIARAIVGALRLTLVGAPGAELVHSATQDAEAHDLYLRGRALVALRNPLALHQAISAFEAALARDPTYAAAEAGLADAYSFLSAFGDVPPGAAFPQAKAAALRALALDSTMAEVHVSLGIINMFYEWDWEAGKGQLLRAIQLNPNLAQAHQFYAWYLVLHKRETESIEEMRLARRLDPLSLIINTRVGTLLRMVGRNAEAITAVQQALALDSNFVPARGEMALLYAGAGRYPEALALVPKVISNDGSTLEACVASMAGRGAEARRLVAELEAVARRQYVTQYLFTQVYTCVGDRERAFAALERGLAERTFALAFVKVDAADSSLRSDPRFAATFRKMHLPL